MDPSRTAIVITGASSGIGRATALAFARRGARLILASRRGDVLEALARECEERGGRAIAVPTDVTDPAAVEALAGRAVEAFGRIDVWFNNAGGGAIGKFTDVPLELHRRTIELNLLGAMHGAAAALPVFVRQRRGMLINNVSIGAYVPTPFASAYTASKFALRGFTGSLRQEMANHPGIRICGLFPAVVDTPGFEHGANHSGRQVDLGPLIYSPERVAEAVVSLVRHPRDELGVGWPTPLARLAYGMFPRLTEHLVGGAMRRSLARARHAPRSDGALIEPKPEGTGTSGGWLRRKGIAPAERISRTVLAVGAVSLAGMLLGGGAWQATRRRPRRLAGYWRW